MYPYFKFFSGIAISAFLINTPSIAAQTLCEDTLDKAAIPLGAYYLTENNATKLQKTLNTYKIVRLKPGGDYRRSLTIKLRSNNALYGLAGTKLPSVIIPEGTRNAILSDVSPANLSFDGFTQITKNNCFNRISNSRISAQSALLKNNLFTDLSNVAIDIDTSQKGYLINNRFIRTMVHAAYPAIKIIGDTAKQSGGNLFIWTNILTPHGDGIIIKNQQNVGFIGIDSESWNWSHKADYPGMMNIMNTDFLSVFMSNGGDNYNNIGQYFNLDVKNIILQGMNIGLTKKPGIILGNHANKLLTIDTQNIGMAKSNSTTQVIDMFNNSLPSISINNQSIPAKSLADSTKTEISNLLQSEKVFYNQLEKPVFKQIPDPAGTNWQTNLKKQPDSADTIQALINKSGIAELQAGIYYISKPLLLKAGQGIVGAGAENTAIIAKSPDIDIITGASHLDEKTIVTSFALADITLQGGRNGISHSASGSGQGADYNLITLSHVTFRNMSNAGISIDNIYAWDNNFIDHSNFYRCKTGIKQRPDPAYIGGDHIGMTFLDKNVFYKNQFIENGIAIDWQANRGNNLNAFISSSFKNNDLAINLNNSTSTFFANSIFETVSEKPILISNQVTGFVNSKFIIKKPGKALFDSNAMCNNCLFENTLFNSGLIVSPTSKNNYFINSTLSVPNIQPINNGLIINSNF